MKNYHQTSNQSKDDLSLNFLLFKSICHAKKLQGRVGNMLTNYKRYARFANVFKSQVQSLIQRKKNFRRRLYLSSATTFWTHA